MQSFNSQDIALIKNMMVSRGARYIASVLGADINQVVQFIAELSAKTGIVTKEQQKTVMTKEKQNKSCLVIKSNAKKEAILKKEKRRREMQDRLNRDDELRIKREKSRGPLFETKNIDYSKLHTVRIDRKTVIYIKPGQDETKAREDFFKRYKKSLQTPENL